MKKVPFNKWATIFFLGLTSLAGYGIYETFSEPTQTLNNLHIPNIEDVLNPTETKTEEEVSATPLTNSTTIETEQPTTSTTQEAGNESGSTAEQKSESLDKHDADYLKRISYWSIAKQYPKYFLLVPKGHEAWKKKTEKMIKLAEEKPDKKLFTYWKGHITPDQLKNNSDWVAHWCRHALAYTELGTWFKVKTNKEYWNLLWDICGREDKSKPKGW